MKARKMPGGRLRNSSLALAETGGNVAVKIPRPVLKGGEVV